MATIRGDKNWFFKDDELVGTTSADWIYGLDGKDVLYGGAGSDRLYGGNHDDRLYGSAGNDTLGEMRATTACMAAPTTTPSSTSTAAI